ncbi:hypothetical protein CAPTEDRAFT_222510 [Capitella teleta]|uniref:TM7S3/TM198-like domain-containing protein n=1 Tax=Capitella teleta TaxID=283909 RepID=R7V3N0_CAPTE|nr:hypothetical protein CAPTEDRAFT_222510 [Capitella teleta]|eukprot:ELU10946.1 hypothetical protein CAPTEDRAFT_222510 [Capitella teleta]
MQWKGLLSVFILLFLVNRVALGAVSYDLTADHPRSILVGPGPATVLRLTGIPSNATHLIIQSHSQWKNFTLSETAENSIQGSHVGLLTLLRVGQGSAVWNIRSASPDPAFAVVMVSVYSKQYPLPGACNMEFVLENDPNIHLTSMTQAFKVQYAEANIGISKRESIPSCGIEISQKRLSYELYEMWMYEGDLSSQHFNRSLQKMLRPLDIRKNGIKVSEVKYHDGQTLKMFAANPGQGVIYNVIVKYQLSQDHVTEAAYVPVVTYSCDDGCSKPVGEYIYFVVLGIVGCVLCFGGHRFFEFELFVFGALAFHIISLSCIGNLTSLSFTESLLVAWVPGIGGGIFWLLIWACFGVAVISALLPAFVCGYVFASIVFNFTPFGSMPWWESDFNYSIAFCCVILIVPVLLLAFLNFMSLLCCAIVGSYHAILLLDVLLGGSLHQVYLDTFRKSVIPGFVQVNDSVPFQFTDLILCICWGALTMFGVILQYNLMRNRPSFPQSPLLCMRKTPRSTNVLINEEPNENTSLLRSTSALLTDEQPPPRSSREHCSSGC